MKKLVKEWVRKAEGDLAVVKKIRYARPPLRDEACFHCQQAAEKYLKALIQHLAISIPRTHNLLDLLALIIPHYPALAKLRRGLRSLRRFAVDYRYPGFSATLPQTRAAVRNALRTRSEIRLLLGLRRLRPF